MFIPMWILLVIGFLVYVALVAAAELEKRVIAVEEALEDAKDSDFEDD